MPTAIQRLQLFYDGPIARHSSFAIRPATPADAPKIAPLLEAFNGPRAHTVDLAKRMAACAGIEVAFLAERAQEVVGFACVQVVPAIGDGVPHAQLTELYVRDQERRRGVGKALLAAAEAHAQLQGAHELWLATGFDNAQAQTFFAPLVTLIGR